MTDPSFDELASAHLDGATTPEEAARVEADPDLLARVEELRQVRAAIAEVPPTDPARRETAIAAARAAFDAPDEAPAASPTVIPLRARAGRRPPSVMARRLLGAAAAVALLALLVPVLGRLGQSNDDDSASFDSTGTAIQGAGDEPGSAEDASGGADTSSTLATDAEGDLGSYENLDQLVETLSAAESRDLAERSPAAFDAAACTAPGDDPEASAGGEGVERATATVAGDAVIVVVRDAASGARTLVVYRASDCTILREVPL